MEPMVNQQRGVSFDPATAARDRVSAATRQERDQAATVERDIRRLSRPTTNPRGLEIDQIEDMWRERKRELRRRS